MDFGCCSLGDERNNHHKRINNNARTGEVENHQRTRGPWAEIQEEWQARLVRALSSTTIAGQHHPPYPEGNSRVIASRHRPHQQDVEEAGRDESLRKGSISRRLFQMTHRIGGNSGQNDRSSGVKQSHVSAAQNPREIRGRPMPSYPSYSQHHQQGHHHVPKPKHRQPVYRSDSLNFADTDKGTSKMRHHMPDDATSRTSSTPPIAAATASSSMDDSAVSEAGIEISMPQKWDSSGPAYAAHTFRAGSHTFTVDTKYSLIRVIGSGAYGVVISALDTPSNSKVAIKMIPRAFHDEVDAKRILREIKLLKHLNHENIIKIVDMMPPLARHVEDFNDVYIVAELMETDLHRIIYSKQSLTIDHVQYFIYQILRALKYIHSANVLHRDLKPSNLLVNSNCDLKICDFGLARGIYPDDDNVMGGSMLLTEYVVTRWYRAPEIMLACHQYTKPIDVWSVGCIFAELLARKPYFPGEDYIDQLTTICDKLGKLPEQDLDFVTSEKAKRFMRKLSDKPVMPLSQQFPKTPPEALDLLNKMLQIHPKKRINVNEALKHPFLAPLHCPEEEPVADRPFDFSFEDEVLNRVRLQELIWEEIGSFRPTCLPVPLRRDVSMMRNIRRSDRRLYEA